MISQKIFVSGNPSVILCPKEQAAAGVEEGKKRGWFRGLRFKGKEQ